MERAKERGAEATRHCQAVFRHGGQDTTVQRPGAHLPLLGGGIMAGGGS